MIFQTPYLYFVTPEISTEPRQWERLVKKAVLGGVDLVQVRDKRISDEKMIEAAQRLQPFLKKYKVPLIINDRLKVALAIQADGIHLGQSDISIEEARASLGSDAIIGVSVENMEQALGVENATYIAASPVFPTQTKKDCNLPWGLEKLKQLCKLSRYPVVAIGGMRLNNIESVLNTGVKGIAVITSIASTACPKKAAQAFKDKMKN